MAKILLILALVAVVAGGAVFFRNQKVSNHIPSMGNVNGPNCPAGSLFSVSPVKSADLLYVVPLGHLNPPDHTIPTDHIYLILKDTNQIIPDSAKEVFAPGDITITSIQKTHVIRGGKLQSDDYSIDFSPCKNVRGKFGHVTKLSPDLTKLMETNDLSCDTRKSGPSDEATYCRKDLNFQVKAGELIGEAGGGSATGLDFQLIDRRSEKLNYANPKRYREDAFHFVCPLDFFDQTSKDSLYQKLGNNSVKRTIEPRCGEVNQDIVGTVQGNWTSADGLIDAPENWSKTLALVHDNTDPSIGVLSIGGVISTPQRILFSPKTDGQINRDFSQVKVDEKIYCYEGRTAGQQQGGQSGRGLIQLDNETTMKVENQSGSCDGNVSFSSPTMYQR